MDATIQILEDLNRTKPKLDAEATAVSCHTLTEMQTISAFCGLVSRVASVILLLTTFECSGNLMVDLEYEVELLTDNNC